MVFVLLLAMCVLPNDVVVDVYVLIPYYECWLLHERCLSVPVSIPADCPKYYKICHLDHQPVAGDHSIPPPP
ncbi:hypothetical protein P8452_02497 [Trifolium repens]|nr:hypothetical protein P8452_02497 [Trifolium repens]